MSQSTRCSRGHRRLPRSFATITVLFLVDTIIPPEIRGVGTIRPEPHCDGFHDRIIFGKQGGLIQRAVPPDLHRGRVDARYAPRKQNRVLTARQPAHQDVLNSISFGWARLELRAILRD